MDDSGRKRRILIPFIYVLFFLFVTTGGILLIIYAFFPSLSQPWHPAAAFTLIGFTWIFWLLTYIYSWIKLCLLRDAPQNVPRQTTRKASVKATHDDDGSPSDHLHDSSVAAAGTSNTTPTYAS